MPGITAVIYPVADLDKAKAFFSALAGRGPDTESPYYVGWNIDGQDIGLDPHTHKHGVTPYWDVPDIKATLQSLVDAGASVIEDVRDVGAGKLVAVLKDAGGNVIGISQEP